MLLDEAQWEMVYKQYLQSTSQSIETQCRTLCLFPKAEFGTNLFNTGAVYFPAKYLLRKKPVLFM